MLECPVTLERSAADFGIPSTHMALFGGQYAHLFHEPRRIHDLPFSCGRRGL